MDNGGVTVLPVRVRTQTGRERSFGLEKGPSFQGT
jgi:hypothetical protein